MTGSSRLPGTGPARAARGDSHGGVSVVLAGVIAAAALLVQGVVGAASLLVDRHALAAAADSAALAAADSASGLRPGSPCDAAADLAAAQSAGLSACRIEGSTVTVRLSRTTGLVPLAAVATAGQPPDSLGAPTVGS